MKQTTEIQLIEISQIINTRKFSLHPFETFFSEETQESIATIGIIHPPIVQKTEDSYQLICGHKRLLHFHEKNQPKVACVVLSENIPLITLLNVILTDQQLNGPLSIVERAYFLKLCREHISDEETLSHFSAKIPCRKHKSAIDEGMNILNFDPSTLLSIHNGTIAAQTAATILSMNQQDRKAIVYLINYLQPGGGKQKRIISLLRDICGREGLSIGDYLEKARVQEILNHKEMNRPQKTQQLTEYLQTAHAPQLTQAQNNFSELQQQLNLPENTSLHHSPAFEKDEVTFSLHFKNIKEFKAELPSLREYISRLRR